METVIDTLVVKVDADTSSLRHVLAQAQEDFEAVGAAAEKAGSDVEEVRAEGVDLGDALAEAFEDAVGRIGESLLDLVAMGEFSFAGLKRVALSAVRDIAEAVLSNVGGGGGGALSSLFGGGGSGFLSSIAGLFGGRAIGGQVTTDRPFLVGERGPELFFPGQAGRVEPIQERRADRPVSITINVNNEGGAPMSRESAGQIALQVRRAVERAGRDQ
ncbi:MAG: hypothetical protein PVF65_05520 [Sphingomonadales bacterium]